MGIDCQLVGETADKAGTCYKQCDLGLEFSPVKQRALAGMLETLGLIPSILKKKNG